MLLYMILNDLELYRAKRLRLHEKLFFSGNAVAVWEIIKGIEAQKLEPSVILVEEVLANSEHSFSIIDWALDFSLANFTARFDDLLLILELNYQKRQMIDYRSNIDALISTRDLDKTAIMGQVTEQYLKMLQGESQDTTMENADVIVSRLYDEISEGNVMRGISTGFQCLDEKVMGLKRGDLFVIGAQTSGGKTALALNIARNVAVQGKEVAFFSLEMRPEKLFLRIAATMLGISANKIADTDHWNSHLHANFGTIMGQIAKFPIRMPPCESFTLENIINLIRQSHQKKPLDLVIIDYLQIISAPNSTANRAAYISHVCTELKSLAMTLGLPVIVLAQLNRTTNTGAVHKPELWQLKESGSIEQAADVVVLIHRNKFGPGSEGFDDRLGTKLAELRIVKNRDGECADLLVAYDAEITQFTEIHQDELAKLRR